MKTALAHTLVLFGRHAVPLLCCLLLFGLAVDAHAQHNGGTDSTDAPSVVTDTLSTSVDTTDQGTTAVLPYSREQEEKYRSALRLHLPPSARFRAEARMMADEWMVYTELRRTSPMAALRSNMDIPDELYIPTDREQYLHDYSIAMSRYVPNLGPPRAAGSTGLTMPLRSIAQFFGLVEDVSPTVNYSVEYPAVVEAVVYSTQAKVVAVMFKGVQQPGRYSLTWNGRDDLGKPLPGGDYIAEIRIGQESIVRKRIQIP